MRFDNDLTAVESESIVW